MIRQGQILDLTLVSLTLHYYSLIYKLQTGNPIGSTRKNHPLCHETIRWKSDVPLTEGQLRSKRDEFWDTAPAFEGRKEIWDALRAAAVAAETKDYELAQAILDGASVSVPNGYLTECYDELGARYQVPIYCLSYPINIVKEDSGRDSPAECSEPVDGGTETILKLRLSHNCTDVKLAVYSTDTISVCKKKLQVSHLYCVYIMKYIFPLVLESRRNRIIKTTMVLWRKIIRR